MSATTSPHRFKPLRLWDLRSGGRCRRCYVPMEAHPIHFPAPARLPGDTRKAELSFDALSKGFGATNSKETHDGD